MTKKLQAQWYSEPWTWPTENATGSGLFDAKGELYGVVAKTGGGTSMKFKYYGEKVEYRPLTKYLDYLAGESEVTRDDEVWKTYTRVWNLTKSYSPI